MVQKEHSRKKEEIRDESTGADKIETLIQHNEAGTKTWLPLEYDLNLTYGNEICESFEKTKRLRDKVREDAVKLMEEEKNESRI
ncbi:hypothetical protein AALB39_25330 [Lachnospiraceae bacterium 54-53]